MDHKKIVLFLCTGNSCRSQIAEGLFRELDKKHEFLAQSAGLNPESSIHPQAIEVMQEIGIDISTQKPKSVHEFLGKEHVTFLITVCSHADKSCPSIWPGLLDKNRFHWDLDDPAQATGTDKEIKNFFKNTREILKSNINDFINTHSNS